MLPRAHFSRYRDLLDEPAAMWCCRCQQEVPADRGLIGRPKCPRCKSLLMPPAEARAIAAVADCGLELDAFSHATRPLPAIRAQFHMGDGADELRRLQRLLRPVRIDQASWTRAAEAFPFREPSCMIDQVAETAPAITPTCRREPSASAGANLLLMTGATALISGMLLLVTANMLLHAAAWRWGFAVAVGGQGVLIAAVAMMAIRLWRNSRRLNYQLDAVDRRLLEVQSALSEPSAALSTSSLRSTLRRINVAESRRDSVIRVSERRDYVQ